MQEDFTRKRNTMREDFVLIAYSDSSKLIYIEKVFELFNSDQNRRSYGFCALSETPCEKTLPGNGYGKIFE